MYRLKLGPDPNPQEINGSDRPDTPGSATLRLSGSLLKTRTPKLTRRQLIKSPVTKRKEIKTLFDNHRDCENSDILQELFHPVSKIGRNDKTEVGLQPGNNEANNPQLDVVSDMRTKEDVQHYTIPVDFPVSI